MSMRKLLSIPGCKLYYCDTGQFGQNQCFQRHSSRPNSKLQVNYVYTIYFTLLCYFTDSLIYELPKGVDTKIPLHDTNYLDFKDEIGAEWEILQFVSLGSKNYSLQLRKISGKLYLCNWGGKHFSLHF